MSAVTNTLVHLIGLPGVGKLTIAKELAALLPARLVDNHSLNNVIFNVVPPARGEAIPDAVWDCVHMVRNAVLNSITELAPREHNYIFTNYLVENDEDDLAIMTSAENCILKRGGHFVPVTLTAHRDEHLQRYTTEARRAQFKMTVPEQLHKIYDNGIQPLQPKRDKALKLDVTSLSALGAAEAIVAHCKQVCA